MVATLRNNCAKGLQDIPTLLIDQGVHLLWPNGELVTGRGGDLVDHWQGPAAVLQGLQVSYAKVPLWLLGEGMSGFVGRLYPLLRMAQRRNLQVSAIALDVWLRSQPTPDGGRHSDGLHDTQPLQFQ